jgi:integrase
VRRKHAVTSNRVRAVLSAMFNHAIVLKWITANPINKAVKRHCEAPHERYLSDDEFARLDVALKNSSPAARQAADVVRLLYWTGSRKGETMAAKWSEFDLEKRTWTKPSHHTKQKRTHHVKLHPEALALLLDLKARAREGAIYVFPGVDGRPLAGIKTAWRNLMRRAQITGFRVHDLRHTFASRLINQGASLSEVGKLLGHTQPATTFRYAHLSLDAQERTLALLAWPRVALPEPEAA